MSDHQRTSPRLRGKGGRPSKGPRNYLGIRVPAALHEAMEEARAETDLTANDFAIGLIEQAMAAGLLPSGHAHGQERLPLSA